MKKLIALYRNSTEKILSAKDLPLLFMRLVLAYGFYGPAIKKWNNIHDITDWFSSLGIIAPKLNAYLAATTEITGVVLLTLGLATRFISIPLIITMIVAIKTVHWGNGFDAGNNGWEIPLYYMIMLFTLFIYGPGKISIDNFINKKIKYI
ncbi:MAG TPA: DoxX family protein [Ferruginibacter sp.]|nr:DoxX family protein [Ferruginibacter sp.]